MTDILITFLFLSIIPLLILLKNNTQSMRILKYIIIKSVNNKFQGKIDIKVFNTEILSKKEDKLAVGLNIICKVIVFLITFVNILTPNYLVMLTLLAILEINSYIMKKYIEHYSSKFIETEDISIEKIVRTVSINNIITTISQIVIFAYLSLTHFLII